MIQAPTTDLEQTEHFHQFDRTKCVEHRMIARAMVAIEAFSVHNHVEKDAWQRR